ncbi:5-formyltetrahydrofolate cyclo-ligase [uncultured Sphaerochaeta sp.]|uniref:5-formyltetrahydrofolate cyclo-ligase n=1 Tax=uncultured Sphaerochaeta sp. TaxID=886478 RepID=UPI002A0A3337|nr:5-formyltetrahydrofolate cyclo-ligase [uncultured Sphaerochaeta sp.]
MVTKKELRDILKKEAAECKNKDFSPEDNASIEALLASEEYLNAHLVFAFVPLSSEVDIKRFLYIVAKEKQLALPKCLGEGLMEFCLVEKDWEQKLEVSSQRIAEPKCGKTIEPDEHSLILVPAMAYSKQKERLGRGMGYYDRFLNRFPTVMTIGLCRKYQLFDSIPIERFDKNVNKVLSAGVFY